MSSKENTTSSFTLSFCGVIVYLIFIIGCSLLVSNQLDGIANDPGLGWHLQSGIDFLSSEKLPEFDPYLGLEPPAKWIADQWLGSTLLALTYQMDNWSALYLLSSFVFLLLYSVVLPIFLTNFTGKPLSSLIFVSLSIKLGFLQFIIRPVLFSLLFFTLAHIWLYYLLRRVRNGGSIKVIEWIFFPLFIVLWTNIHPYVVLLFISSGILFFGYLIEQIVEKFDQKLQAGFTSLLLFPLFLALFTLCNPYLFELHQSVWFLGKSDFLTSFLHEWTPLNFSSPEGRIFQVILFLSFIGYVSEIRKSKNLFIPELLLCFAYIRFGIESVRAVPLACVCLAPFATYGIASLFSLQWYNHFPLLKKLQSFFISLSSTIKSSEQKWYATITVTLLFVTIGVFSSLPSSTLGPSKDIYPFGALETIRNYSKEKGAPIKILNDLNWGGFLIFNLTRDEKPLFDDRLTLQDEKVFKDYVNSFVAGKDWRSYIDNQEADLLIVKKESVIGRILSSAVIHEPLYGDELVDVYRLPLENSQLED